MSIPAKWENASALKCLSRWATRTTPEVLWLWLELYSRPQTTTWLALPGVNIWHFLSAWDLRHFPVFGEFPLGVSVEEDPWTQGGDDAWPLATGTLDFGVSGWWYTGTHLTAAVPGRSGARAPGEQSSVHCQSGQWLQQHPGSHRTLTGLALGLLWL